MGYWKQRQLEQGEYHFSAPPGYAVCDRCVDDDALAAFVADNADATTCSFCGRDGEESIAADTDAVVLRIGEALQLEWDVPENALFRDSESPTGWFGPEPWDTADVLEHEGWPFATQAFADFVVDAFRETTWIPRDPYALSEREALAFSWELFAETVKHGTRFVFALLPEATDEQDDPGAPVRRGALFLEEIGRLINAYDLIAEVGPVDALYRVRVRDAGEEVQSAADLGTPPPERASQSRMSPAGISMLYCARDTDTALGETVDTVKDASRVACIATFRLREATSVIDLGRLPPVPSLFDPQASRRERAELSFLHAFDRDLSAHIERDDRVHIDYVPTQVVTEYIRRVFRDRRGLPIQGLAFDSAQVQGGRNIVLFIQQDQCVERGAPEPLVGGPVVELVDVQHRPV